MLGTFPTMLGTPPTMLGTFPTMLGTPPTMLGTTPTMLGTPGRVGILSDAQTSRWGLRERIRTACRRASNDCICVRALLTGGGPLWGHGSGSA